MLIPFVYSFFFLTSAWDPYGNTGKIPVAVVNEDQPAELEGTKIQAGADTIKELKSDDQLDWQFVDAKQAAKGLKDNKYYTVITIPKDFSKNAATVLDANPKQMNLKYETNGSLNYISEVISQVGTGKLNEQIKEKVTTAFVSQLFNQVKEIGSQLKVAADGSGQITDGLGTLSAGLTKYTNGVTQVNDGLGQLHAKVPTLADGVNKLDDGGGQLHTGLGTLNSQIPTLSSGVKQLDNGGVQLKNGLTQLNDQVPALTNGVEQLTAGLNQVHGAVVSDSTNVGTETLSSGVEKLAQGITDLKYYTLDSTHGDAQKNLPDGVTMLREKMQKLSGVVAAQVKQIGQVQSMLMPMNKNLVTKADTAETAAIEKLEADLPADASDEVKKDISDLKAKAAAHTTKVNGYMKNVEGIVGTINTNLTTTTTDAAGDPEGLQSAITMFTDNLTIIDNELSHPEISGHPGYADAVQQLTTGLAQLNQSVNVGSGSTPSLVSAMTQLNDGMNELHSKTPALADGVGKLHDGSVQLSDGLIQLDSKVPALALGVGKLYDGSAQLYAGLEQLNSNVPALTSGVQQLYDGTNQLVANNDQLLSGTGKISDGSGTLTNGLEDGYKQVTAAKLTKLTAKMFASPTTLSQSRLTTVPNYGAAIAPFVLAMALFIGIIIFNFIYSFAERPTNRKELIGWITAKLAICTGFAVAASVLEAFLIRIAGLQVNNVPAFYGIAILFGISAMYVTMLFNLLFGKAGIFIALGLLTLSGSGGLFR